MKTKKIDLFIQKLEMNVKENQANTTAFKLLQEESLELLNDYVSSTPASIESMRLLTRFKLRVTQVHHSMHSKKKRVIISNNTLNLLLVQ